MTTSTQLDEQLENIVDAAGLPSVLESLFRICCAKAEHIRTNWNDPELAEGWDRAATKLEFTHKELSQ